MYTDNVWFTWIFSTLVSLDEAHYEKHQDEESDGTHQSNKPALGSNVYLPAGYGWREKEEGEAHRDKASAKI